MPEDPTAKPDSFKDRRLLFIEALPGEYLNVAAIESVSIPPINANGPTVIVMRSGRTIETDDDGDAILDLMNKLTPY